MDARFRVDAVSDLPGGCNSVPEEGFATGHLDKGFVNGEGLHLGGVLFQNIDDPHGNLNVGGHPGADQLGGGTKFFCPGDRHSRLHTQGFGLIGSGQHNPVATFRIPADDDWLLPQCRIECLFHTGVKSVHVSQQHDRSEFPPGSPPLHLEPVFLLSGYPPAAEKKRGKKGTGNTIRKRMVSRFARIEIHDVAVEQMQLGCK